MIAQEGRPSDTSGRLEKEIRTYDLLDGIGVSYYRIDHDPAMKIEACAELDKVLGTTICKNLFLCN
jgi:Ala-tRNA(Pro) deacylase